MFSGTESPLSDHRTSEVEQGFDLDSSSSSSSSSASSPSTQQLPSSPPQLPTLYEDDAQSFRYRPTKRRRLDTLDERQLGVRSDDVRSEGLLRSSPPRRAKYSSKKKMKKKKQKTKKRQNAEGKVENTTMTDAEFKEVVTLLRRRRHTVKSFLRTLMWDFKKHHASAVSLKELWLDEQNPFVLAFEEELTLGLMQVHEFRLLEKTVRNEVQQYGDEVVQAFKVPETLDRSMNLKDEIAWLGNGALCRNHAPLLSLILCACTHPLRRDSTRPPPWSSISMILAQISYISAPVKHSRMAKCLGLFLNHHHLTRQALDILNAFGLVASYQSINDTLRLIKDSHIKTLQGMATMMNRVLVYDNLNRVDNVREAKAGKEKKSMNITTGLAKASQHIPKEGIMRSWLDFSKDLTAGDIISLRATDLAKEAATENQLWQYYAFDAIRQAFPGILQACTRVDKSRLSSAREFTSELPNLGRPRQHKPDWTIPLGPLMFDEATIEGTSDVFRDIYENQFKIDDDDPTFKDRFFLMFGDALTTMRMTSWKADQSEDTTAYGDGKWLLPIFGLWHLKYNYAKMIIEEHWGSQQDDFACLDKIWNSMYVNRKCEKQVFQVIDGLILESFQSRFVALSLVYLQEQTMNGNLDCPWVKDKIEFPNREQVWEWWKTQPVRVLNGLVNWLVKEIDLLDNEEKGRLSGRDTADDEWKNHLHFIHNVFPYAVLTDAIKHCDLGLIRFAMRLTLVMFAGHNSKWLYQRELCWYNWLINSDAATTQLQDIVIKESLINRQGRADSYYPMDLANELLNLLISKVKTFRRTSELQVFKLVERVTRSAHYLHELSEAFDKHTQLRRTTYHSKKRVEEQIWLMAIRLYRRDSFHNSSITYTPGRGSRGYTRLWLRDGTKRLNQVIQKFNNLRVRAKVTAEDTTAEDADQQLENDSAYRSAERKDAVVQRRITLKRQMEAQEAAGVVLSGHVGDNADQRGETDAPQPEALTHNEEHEGDADTPQRMLQEACDDLGLDLEEYHMEEENSRPERVDDEEFNDSELKDEDLEMLNEQGKIFI